MTDPITTLHYAPGANIVNGAYAPGADGFNLADVSTGELSSLPTGVKGLVWLGDTSGLTASFEASVNAAIGQPNLYGFYLADEPGAGDAANLKAEADYIHATVPGAKVFMVEQNLGTPNAPQFLYNPANTDIDLFGLDPYPVRSDLPGGFEPSIIITAVSAAVAQGIPQADIVPVYQAFGNESPWVTPTAAQEQTILSTWGSVIPSPAFDFAYSWGVQDGDTALVTDPTLQAVFATHNALTGSSPPPPPAPPPAAAPTLVLAEDALSVRAGHSVALGISAIPAAAGDKVKVTISGVPSYETISAPRGDTVTHNSGTWTITDNTAGATLSGLTLHSNYQGHGHPVASLSVDATDLTSGINSAAQLLQVTDPPATTTAASDSPSEKDYVWFNRAMASGFESGVATHHRDAFQEQVLLVAAHS
jgi:hypothetical protein